MLQRFVYNKSSKTTGEPMLTSVQGAHRKGKIELEQKPENVGDETRVIVTFLDSSTVDLHKRGISKAQAKILRA
jgi:hypothetical protein